MPCSCKLGRALPLYRDAPTPTARSTAPSHRSVIYTMLSQIPASISRRCTKADLSGSTLGHRTNNSGTVWPAGDPTPSLSAPLTRTRRSPTELFRLTHPFAHIQTSKQHQARRHRRLSRPAPILQPAQAPRCRLTLSDRLSRRAAAVRWACADLASCRSDYARASSCVSVCWMSCRVCLRAADRFLCVRWAWTESGTWTGHGEFAEQGPGKELGVCGRLCGRGLGRRGRRGVSRACLNGWSVGLRRCV